MPEGVGIDGVTGNDQQARTSSLVDEGQREQPSADLRATGDVSATRAAVAIADRDFVSAGVDTDRLPAHPDVQRE